MAEKKQAPLNTLLTIYFYHTRLTRESYEEWKEYKFPGHILYGLPPDQPSDCKKGYERPRLQDETRKV